jgi:hypothetical protein
MSDISGEAAQAVAEANARAAARAASEAAKPRVDYDALNRMVRRQRAALTRAKNSGDPNRVIVACRDAVREWNQPGAMWPDDWPTWRNALWDATNYRVELEDLA